MSSNLPAQAALILLALIIAACVMAYPSDTETEEPGMTGRIVEQTGIKEAKAESIARVLNHAGFPDADGFSLTTAEDGKSHTLRFVSGGHEFTLELSRYLLCQRITDEAGETVYAMIY